LKLELSNIGKHFAYRWVFKNVSFILQNGQSMAITGPNGIGKSTLLKIISGYTDASEGKVHYLVNNSDIKTNSIYNYLSYAAPYIDLIDDFTLSELINLYASNKKIDQTILTETIEAFKLKDSLDKYLKYFSSGMVQRARLLLALSTSSELYLFDEPYTNLDKDGISVFEHFYRLRTKNAISIICSNRQEEINLCDSVYNLKPIC
jgi:ABC-type multidrug transport system ATPase subunit